MKFVSKLAAFGATAALATTGLVAAGTAADAATVPVNYNCDLSAFAPLLPPGTPTSQQITAAYDVPALTSLVAGAPVASKKLTARITIPAVVSGLVHLGFEDKVSGTVSGNVTFGPQHIAASLTIPEQKISNPAGPNTVNASGSLAGFTPTRAGANAVSLPSTVTAVLGGQDITCAAAAGSPLALGTASVASPALSVKAPKSAKLHKAVKIKVTTNQTGKVIAKIKGKKVAKAKVKAGHATLKVKKGLTKGKNKIVVSLGSLHKTVKVKVKK